MYVLQLILNYVCMSVCVLKNEKLNYINWNQYFIVWL